MKNLKCVTKESLEKVNEANKSFMRLWFPHTWEGKYKAALKEIRILEEENKKYKEFVDFIISLKDQKK